MARSNVWAAIAAIGTLLGGVAAVGLLIANQQDRQARQQEPAAEAPAPVDSPTLPDTASVREPERSPENIAAPAPSRSFPNSDASTDFCARLSTLIENAPSNFEGWKTGPPLPQRDGSTFWTATHMLPGAHDCAVSRLPQYSEQAFACFWNLESEDDAVLARAELIRDIRSCPGITRGTNGHPSSGRVQFMVRPLSNRPNVIVMDVADLTSLQADEHAGSDVPK